jgi:DNA-binding GntR family transcriptional regulator
VRHALSELVNQGILRTVQGVGTFVADARYVKTAEYLYGMSQEMEMHGVEVSSRILQAELIEADAFLARRTRENSFTHDQASTPPGTLAGALFDGADAGRLSQRPQGLPAHRVGREAP